MPAFKFSAVNQVGEVQKGVLHGKTLEAAIQQLSGQGLTIHEISLAEPDLSAPPEPKAPLEARSKFHTDVIGPILGGVPLPDLHFFFRQMASMLHAGIGAVQTFETLSRQTKNGKLSVILREVSEQVLEGKRISEGLGRYPEVFSPLILNMVIVGEDGGFMADQAKRIAEYLQRDIELRNLIRRETAYPKITFTFSIILIIGVNFLIPVINPAAAKLPTFYGLWFLTLAIVIGTFFFRKYALKQPSIREKWDQFVARLPFIGSMWQGFAMAKFGRAFGALYASGVPLGKATRLAADSSGNEYVRSRVIPLAPRMDSGETVSTAFAESGVFTPIVIEMARTGETTGNMDEMMTKVAEYYEEEGQVKARQAATVLGVVMLVLVGIYVGFVLVTFYTGYFSRAFNAG